jgi:hypothetical protein
MAKNNPYTTPKNKRLESMGEAIMKAKLMLIPTRAPIAVGIMDKPSNQ